ncbi:DUF748 domain-containing protein [Massilia sp. SM-13]|uniref:DUF748 domain-containing protein n=1 Tax=Pseudoduganella rhizocola TaxID=3382643 RepID=UPI0038B47D19
MKTPSFKYLVPGVLAGLALAYTGFGFLAVPAIMKSQATQFAAEKLHRQLTIEKAEFNPFTLSATLQGVKMMEPDGATVFAGFERLGIDIAWQSLFRMAPVVQEVRLTKPVVRLVRKDANHYSIDDILAFIASQPPSPEPTRYSVNNIQLEGGTLSFDDRPAGVRHEVADLNLGLPFISSLPADVEVFVEPLFSARVNGAPLHLSGKARPFAESKDYVMALDIDDADIAAYLGYLPGKPNFRLQGARLSAKLQATFTQPKGKSSALLLGGQASLKDVALQQADGKPLLKLKEFSAQLGKLDVLAGRYELASIRLQGLDADLVRDRDGRLNVDKLLGQPAAPAKAEASSAAPRNATAPYISLKALDIGDAAVRYTDGGMHAGVGNFSLAARDMAADLGKNTIAIGSLASDSAGINFRQGKAASAPAAQKDAAPAGNAAPLLLTVGKLDIANWSARVQDDSHEQPVVFDINPLSFAVQGFSTAPASTSTFELKANVNKTGKLALGGELALAPFKSDLKLELKNFGLLPLQPYVTDYVNLRVARGDLSGQGRLQLAAAADGKLRGGFTGDVSVGKLSTVDKASANDFLSWDSLAFQRMDLQLQPFALSVERVVLADFFSRVIIDPNGRINVQDVMRDAAAGDKSLTDAGERAQAAVQARRNKKQATPVPAPALPAEPLPPIRIGQLALSGGRVRFTDNFIKPNYTANLRDIGGAINGLSSDPASAATVSLKGNVNSAPLSIAGRVNPLKRDLSLDLKADVRGMELAQLSAYADKYVGYGIEKGKLSFEVAYQLEGRQLKAENRLILDQLTFGKESTNPEATKLPVQLAVALLSDRNGVIDLNVPIGGSLDDPEFSIGGIILKIIGNAVLKTVTAPFALLGSMFGGGEELSAMEFETGRALVPAAGEAKLKSLAAAMTERPGLKLDITGRYDPATETETLRRLAMERKLRMLKTRDLQAKDAPLPEGGVVVAQAEYADLLARVYRNESFDKPRNLLGLQKNLAVAEMEKLILAHTAIDDDDLLALGNRRAQAVRDWLVTKGQVPAERLFITGAKAAGQDGKGSGSRAEFSLH